MWKVGHWLLSISGGIVFSIRLCAVIISTDGSTVKVVKLTLTPANPTIAVGESQQFVLIATLENGLIIQQSSELVNWRTSDPGVAVVTT